MRKNMKNGIRKSMVPAVMAALAVTVAACGSSAGITGADGTAEAGDMAEAVNETESVQVQAAEEPESITITALDANGEETQVEVAYKPARVAVLDMAALDIIDNLGVGGCVVGSASTSLEYLQEYVTDEKVANLGTIKEADLEAVMACEPEIIFIGGRLSSSYDALSEIAPVVYLATDSELGVVGSVRKNATAIASVFGLEDEITEKLSGFDERILALEAIAEGRTAVVGMCTSGSFNVLGNEGRCSIIGGEIGFENLCADTKASGGGSEGSGGGSGSSSTHGDEASFELVVKLNPDYIFVMDRDAAIGTNGAKAAQEIMENELIMGTDAYQNGNIVYLEHPAVWYTAEGGITALDVMLADLESALRARQ